MVCTKAGDPKRTVKVFKYFVGPLQERVCEIMKDLSKDYIYVEDDDYIIYVLMAAAEALAVGLTTLLETLLCVSTDINALS